MKKRAAEIVTITPATTGWAIHRADHEPHLVASLEDATQVIPSSCVLRLAVPVSIVVLERLTLPSTAPEELAGMVRLQSEKSLLFSMEEISSDFVMVEARDQESAVLSVSAPHAPLEALCRPLRGKHLLPERVTPFVFHIATACPANETVLAVYAEQGQLVVAIVESGKLSWAHTVDSTMPERLADELPQLLLPAMMEGVPTTFTRIFLATDCAELKPALDEFFETEVEPLPAPSPQLTLPINLVPVSWHALKDQQQRSARIQKYLMIAAAAVLAIIILATGYIAVLRHQASSLEAQLAALRPKMVLIQDQQARARSLGAAIDPHRYTTEILFLLIRNLPAEGVSLTEFDQTADQWRIVGEAPSAVQASDYISRAKNDQELGAYEISAEPPRMLTNAHWQFNITGKQ